MARQRNWFNVSCKADAEYKARLDDLAESKGVFVGDLVRFALDKTFGSDLGNTDATFFESEFAPMAKKAMNAKREKQPA